MVRFVRSAEYYRIVLSVRFSRRPRDEQRVQAPLGSHGTLVFNRSYAHRKYRRIEQGTVPLLVVAGLAAVTIIQLGLLVHSPRAALVW